METGNRVIVATDDSLMRGWVGTLHLPSEQHPGTWWVLFDNAPDLPLMFRPDELEAAPCR